MSPALRFEGVRKTFSEGRRHLRVVLDGLDLSVPLDRFTYVVGRSGTGKSVLCRLAVGLMRPDAGAVELDGRPVHALPRREVIPLRRRYPYVTQGSGLLDWLTLAQNVALAAPAASDDEVLGALEQVGLRELAGTLPPDNSPGVNKRAALARALLLRPRFLLLDEPTTGLDRRAAAEVNEVLQRLRSERLGALLVSHDYASLERLADAVVVIAQGRVAFHGPPADFFVSSHPEVRALTAPTEV